MHVAFRDRLAETADRVRASDPGLARLRQATGGVVGMASALAAEYGAARLLGSGPQQTLVAMLLGAVTAMMGSMALAGAGTPLVTARIAAGFPVSIGLGMLAGVAVAGHTDLMLTVFVVVMFVAVLVRRFGLPFFFYGFMTWMGYFFAAFLHATWAMVPSLLGAVVLATAVVLLLSLTVLRGNPARTLQRTLAACEARGRAVVRAAARVLTAEPEPRPEARARRRLAARQAGLAEAALIAEGWTDDPATLPAGWSGSALRRQLLDLQHVTDRLAGSAAALRGGDATLVAEARVALDALARGADATALAAAARLSTSARAAASPEQRPEGWWPAAHLADAVAEYVEVARQSRLAPPSEPADGYAPVAPLVMGALPGSPAVAREVAARGAAWNPLARLDLVTRQAVQVAVSGGLAIVLGRELSATRYYWAVIAAFVAFTGTATRSETFLKAINRVVGTMAGLVASIWLAGLTGGSTAAVLAVVLASMFLGFYLVRVSYAYMIFFVTIMVGQLYGVLHEFSDGLLVLRLEETAIGAAVGIAVALVVTPLSTSDTARVARDGLLGALAELLEAAADTVAGDTRPGRDARPGLDAGMRAVDNAVRQLQLVARPLTRPVPGGSRRATVGHRVALYSASAAYARALVVSLRADPDVPGAAVACRELASAARALTAAAPGRPLPSLAEPLRAADEALFGAPEASTPAGQRARRALAHLHVLLGELAVVPASGVVDAPAPAGAPLAA